MDHTKIFQDKTTISYGKMDLSSKISLGKMDLSSKISLGKMDLSKILYTLCVIVRLSVP